MSDGCGREGIRTGYPLLTALSIMLTTSACEGLDVSRCHALNAIAMLENIHNHYTVETESTRRRCSHWFLPLAYSKVSSRR